MASTVFSVAASRYRYLHIAGHQVIRDAFHQVILSRRKQDAPVPDFRLGQDFLSRIGIRRLAQCKVGNLPVNKEARFHGSFVDSLSADDYLCVTGLCIFLIGNRIMFIPDKRPLFRSADIGNKEFGGQAFSRIFIALCQSADAYRFFRKLHCLSRTQEGDRQAVARRCIAAKLFIRHGSRIHVLKLRCHTGCVRRQVVASLHGKVHCKAVFLFLFKDRTAHHGISVRKPCHLCNLHAVLAGFSYRVVRFRSLRRRRNACKDKALPQIAGNAYPGFFLIIADCTVPVLFPVTAVRRLRVHLPCISMGRLLRLFPADTLLPVVFIIRGIGIRKRMGNDKLHGVGIPAVRSFFPYAHRFSEPCRRHFHQGPAAEGRLQHLSAGLVRDLIGFLCHKAGNPVFLHIKADCRYGCLYRHIAVSRQSALFCGYRNPCGTGFSRCHHRGISRCADTCDTAVGAFKAYLADACLLRLHRGGKYGAFPFCKQQGSRIKAHSRDGGCHRYRTVGDFHLCRFPGAFLGCHHNHLARGTFRSGSAIYISCSSIQGQSLRQAASFL